jgi:polysaccharide biosynthesis protein PslG
VKVTVIGRPTSVVERKNMEISTMYRLLRIIIGMALFVTLALSQNVRSAPSFAPGDSAFGVNSHIASRYRDYATLNTPIETTSQSSTGWVREDFQMSRIEPKRGEFDWNWSDQMVSGFTQRGVSVLGILNAPTPAWATAGGPGGDFYPPDSQAFADFASAVVGRYKDRVHYWQIWNEPDNAIYWRPQPSPSAYASLLKAVSRAIKAADPSAQVLSAGVVSPEPATSFYQAIADNGAWDSFDIIAIHPYTDPRSPEDGQIGSAGVGQIKALAARLGQKPIWATEYGWSTASGDRSGNQVSDDTQANYLVRGAAMLRAAGVDRVFWYNLKDNHPGDGLGLLGYGAGDADYSQPKPSFLAFRTLNQQLVGTSPAGMLDLGQRSTILDFENFGSWKRGNEPNGTFTQSSAQAHSGSFSGQLSYNFPTTGNDYVVFSPGSQPTISGSPSQLGIWVYGDGSGHALKVWLRDSEGETLQFRLGFVGAAGWQFLSTPINGTVESYNRISGSGNLRLDLPARLVSVVLDDEPNSKIGSGTIYLDDLSAVTGPEAYGARFAKGDGSSVDVIWAPQVTEINLPTSSAQGTRVEIWGETKTETSHNGVFTLGVGPNPIFLSHVPGQNPTPPPPTALPTTPPVADSRCFPETGFCIAGPIRTYWEQNGGLPVFGYPIAAQGQEQIEGHPFQVQWFERNRLEIHPENQPPYNVLLGRLGADRLSQQGQDWTLFPKGSEQAGCRFFPQTGHSVCGEILAAWRANGLELDGQPGKNEGENLALFGLPLSEPRVETLSDGRQYTVQWFERARFELHPENAPPYNVLLGLLGRETRDGFK